MSNYGIFSQLLHQFALGSKPIAEISFELDQKISRPDAESIRQEQHIFIAGLARSGTTILMRRFYESGQFCSLTYRDMPFVLAPNLWGRIHKLSNHKMEKQERAHGDGLKVDFDSPEALEEVFWRIFCGESYIRKHSLVPMKASKEVTRDFIKYIAAIIQKQNTLKYHRYLSKNNNNILRLQSIAAAFPNAALMIPFRSPLQHAYSLLQQHKKFKKRHEGSRFEAKYMNWLVHHEFGSNHKPFVFEENQQQSSDALSLVYWLELWLFTYRYLLANAPKKAVFISYDRLCTNKKLWERLASYVGISEHSERYDVFQLSSKKVKFDESSQLYEEAARVHGELLQRCQNFEKCTAIDA